MAVLKGTFSGTMLQAPSAAHGGWEALEERIAADQFVSPLSSSLEARRGWCLVGDVLSTSFTDLDAWREGNIVRLGLRVEQRKLPGKLVKATVKARVEAWKKEHGRERCPAVVQREIRESVRGEILPKVLPTLQIHEVLLDVDSGDLFFSSRSAAEIDRCRKMLDRTFGEGWIVDPLRFLDLEHRAKLMVSGPTRFSAVDVDDAIPEDKGIAPEDTDDLILNTPSLGADLLTWLWWRSETGQQAYGDITAWVEDRIVFRDAGEDSPRVIVTAALEQAKEVKTAFASGRLPQEIHVELIRGDRAYTFSLNDRLQVSHLKLPPVTSRQDPEVAAERLFFFQEAFEALHRDIFNAFAFARADRSAWREIVEEVRDWIRDASTRED